MIQLYREHIEKYMVSMYAADVGQHTLCSHRGQHGINIVIQLSRENIELHGTYVYLLRWVYLT
jgi:hypothetical protein